MSKASRNEQRKLTANYLNGIAVALITVGVLAPIIGLLTGTLTNPWIIAFVPLGCGIISVALHYGARQSLRELED